MARAKAQVVSAPVTKGDMIDRMDEIRQLRKPLDAESARLKEEYDELKWKVLAILDSEKEVKAGTKRATVSISENIVCVLNDRTAFLKWALKTGCEHLLTASCVSAPAYREVLQLKGVTPPGTEPFTKRDLNHTSLKEKQ